MPLLERLGLHPPIEPYDAGLLDVTGGHLIYFEQCGNPRGRPALIVHGGPGGGSNALMRRFHDPQHYRIILFDQRGCGRSVPHASIEANTTWDLIDDMERLRTHLRLERWQLLGGSWGSTLALAYAQMHPASVTGLILRGIFLLRRSELDWFYQDGCNWIFPEAYAQFAGIIPAAERGDMIRAFHERLTGPDKDVQLAAARAWSLWEGTTISLLHDPDRSRMFGNDTYALAFARIETHYFVNQGFFRRDGELLERAHRLHAIPGVIIHGRYDVVTPVRNAWDLKMAWPEADLRIVPDAGHAMSEPGIVHEIVAATSRLAGEVGNPRSANSAPC